MRLPQRLGELGADVVPVLARGQAQLGKALRADHVPYAVEPSGHGCGVDLDADRACDTGQRAGVHLVRPRPGRVVGTDDSADAVAVLDAVAHAGVGELAGRHGRHVAAAVVEDVWLPVRAVRPLDEIAGRTRNGIPTQPHVSDRRDRDQPARRRKRHSRIGLRRVGQAPVDPLLEVLADSLTHGELSIGLPVTRPAQPQLRRTTSSVGNTTDRRGAPGSARRSSNTRTACSPRSRMGCRTVVSGGRT